MTVFRDPVTKRASTPGETAGGLRGAGSRRRRRRGGEGSRQKLEKKRADLAVREQEVAGRKQEKWLAIGTAVLQEHRPPDRRASAPISGVGSVLTKNRLEDTAEARLEALRAEVAELERQLAEATAVDPDAARRGVAACRRRGGVKLLRYDLVWVY